jgi:hypothetical protein
MRRCCPRGSSALCRKRLSVVFGQVADALAHLAVHGPAAPADLAGVRFQHAEDDAHGGGLAGAVGAHEPEHLPLGDGEGEVVEGDQVAVAAGQALEFQHVVPTRSRPRCPGSGCTIAAGLAAAVPPREEPGVLLGSYRVPRTREGRVVAAPPPGSRGRLPGRIEPALRRRLVVSGSDGAQGRPAAHQERPRRSTDQDRRRASELAAGSSRGRRPALVGGADTSMAERAVRAAGGGAEPGRHVWLGDR